MLGRQSASGQKWLEIWGSRGVSCVGHPLSCSRNGPGARTGGRTGV